MYLNEMLAGMWLDQNPPLTDNEAMENAPTDTTQQTPPPPHRRGLPLAALLLVVILVSVATTLWIARTWLFPQPFQPVTLNTRERVVLESKLDVLSGVASPRSESAAEARRAPATGALRPEAYSERAADRVVHFTQRELNAMIARNPDLAERVVLHLSDGLLSATMLITLPHDLPVFAGQTVRVATGLRLRHEQGRPIVAIEGVSVMGVPLPAAWLGGLKGHDLVGLYGDEGGIWGAFGDGVRDLRIEQGRLRVELAE